MNTSLIAEVRQFEGEEDTTETQVCEVTDAAGGEFELRVPLSNDYERQVYVTFRLSDLVAACVAFLADKAGGKSS